MTRMVLATVGRFYPLVALVAFRVLWSEPLLCIRCESPSRNPSWYAIIAMYES